MLHEDLVRELSPEQAKPLMEMTVWQGRQHTIHIEEQGERFHRKPEAIAGCSGRRPGRPKLVCGIRKVFLRREL